MEEIEEHIAAGQPALIYFSSAPVRLDSVEATQYEALKQFKRTCQSRGLVEEYDDLTSFRTKFARQLAQTVIRVLGQRGGPDLVEPMPPAAPAMSPEAQELVDASKSDPNVASFQILPHAWSMSLELCFYALAPLLVRRHILIVAGIVISCYALRQYTYQNGIYNSAWAYRFFPFELGLFMTGVLAHRVYEILSRAGLMRFWLSAMVTALVIGSILFHQYIFLLNYRVHTVYTSMILLLPFLFDFARRVPADRWLGELSYPIYLIHLPAGTMIYYTLLHIPSVFRTTCFGMGFDCDRRNHARAVHRLRALHRRTA